MDNKLLDEIWKDILDKNLGDFNREMRNCNINVDDNEFTIRPTDSSRFFAKFDREKFSCLELRTDSKHSLEEITNFCNEVALVLQNYKLELDKIFGVEIKSIEDFKKYCKFLIDAGIEKEYVIGMTKKRSYGDYYDKFGVIFDPNGYFSLEFTDRDKELYGKNRMRCYIEFEKETIDSQDLADFLIKIVEKNKETIEKYIKEKDDEED